MKKILLSATLCIFGYVSQATHLMGGQMTSLNIGGLTYQVTLTAYRDTLGIPMYPTAMITYSDITGFYLQHVVNCSPPTNYGNGVEMYTYVDTVTFPVAGDYTMWWEDCCRNCALLNMTTPCGESFHLYNELHADVNNSSPVFLNPPIPIAQEAVPFNYNPLPFDADGDSIAWVLDIPLGAGGINVVGYSLPPSDISMPFTMNQVTGEITFLPNTLGHFEVSVKVSEFRNGAKIGEIRRDMQIIVIPSLNKPAGINSSSNTFPFSGKQFLLNANAAFNVTVTAVELDNNPVSFTASGEPFILNNNPASAVITNGIGQASATVSWTPDATQTRTNPYIFALRISEEFGGSVFANDVTFKLEVGGATGISDPANAGELLHVYPNPSNGNFYVELNSATQGTVQITVSNIMGQQVSRQADVKVNEGTNIIYLNSMNLTAGQYFITVESNGQQLGIQKIEVK